MQNSYNKEKKLTYMLTILCIDNTDAEHHITLGASYPVYSTGEKGFLVADDNGDDVWLSPNYFRGRDFEKEETSRSVQAE